MRKTLIHDSGARHVTCRQGVCGCLCLILRCSRDVMECMPLYEKRVGEEMQDSHHKHCLKLLYLVFWKEHTFLRWLCLSLILGNPESSCLDSNHDLIPWDFRVFYTALLSLPTRRDSQLGFYDRQLLITRMIIRVKHQLVKSWFCSSSKFRGRWCQDRHGVRSSEWFWLD